MLDVSFLVPTLRDPQRYVVRVINSLARANHQKYKYEVLVYSTQEVTGPSVRWIKEENPGQGSIKALNHLASLSDARYVFTAADDHEAAPNFFDAIEAIDGDFFAGRHYKVLGVTHYGHPAYLSAPYGDNKRFPILGNALIGRSTLENEFGGCVFNPNFFHTYSDNWLSYFLGTHKEPPVLLHNVQMRPFELNNTSHDKTADEQLYYRLIDKLNLDKTTKYYDKA